MATHQMRPYVCKKLSPLLEVPASDKLCQNVEKCIFNWAVKRTKAVRDQPSWENPMFRSRYKQKFLSLHFNLKDSSSKLAENLKSGKVKVTDLVWMAPHELNPHGTMALRRNELKIQALHREAVNTEDEDYEGMFKCGKCKSRKTTYYQMQTRSADEPMTTFVTCTNCQNHWKC